MPKWLDVSTEATGKLVAVGAAIYAFWQLIKGGFRALRAIGRLVDQLEKILPALPAILQIAEEVTDGGGSLKDKIAELRNELELSREQIAVDVERLRTDLKAANTRIDGLERGP